jgi:hypothetical protein
MLLKKIVCTSLLVLAVLALPIAPRSVPTPKPTCLQADGVLPAPPPTPIPPSASG